MIRLSKKWLVPLFRKFHNSLAPAAQPGRHAGNPLLRNAFCGSGGTPGGRQAKCRLVHGRRKSGRVRFRPQANKHGRKRPYGNGSQPLSSCVLRPEGPRPKNRPDPADLLDFTQYYCKLSHGQSKGPRGFFLYKLHAGCAGFLPILHKHSYKPKKYAKIILKIRKIGVDLCINNVL